MVAGAEQDSAPGERGQGPCRAGVLRGAAVVGDVIPSPQDVCGNAAWAPDPTAAEAPIAVPKVMPQGWDTKPAVGLRRGDTLFESLHQPIEMCQ